MDPVEAFKRLARSRQKSLLASVNWKELSDISSYPVNFFTRDELDTIAENFEPTPAGDEAKSEIAVAATARAFAMKQIYEAGRQKSKTVKPISVMPDGVTDVRKTRTRAQEIVEGLRKKAQPEITTQEPQPELQPQEPVGTPEQLDLFNADLILDYSLRDEINGMSIPMYALAKRPDRNIWRWDSSDGKRWIEISSHFLAEQLEESGSPKDGEVVHGRATVFDKDIIIYSVSKINEAMSRGLPVGPTIRFTAYDFLTATRRTQGGQDYENMMATLRRLRSTNVETNVISADGQTTKISGIINDAEVKRGVRGELQYVELTLANWLYAAIKAHKVLAINPKYFDLTRPLERVLYSIARKYVGHQGLWKISLRKLKDKCGSAPKSPLRKFLFDVNQVIKADCIPDYRLSVKKEGDEHMVTFYSRDAKELLSALANKKKRKEKSS